jgi:hypothetical protein
MVPQQIMTEVAVPPRCHDVRNSSLMRLCIRGYIDIKSNSRGCMPFTTTQLPELAISLASATDTPPSTTEHCCIGPCVHGQTPVSLVSQVSRFALFASRPNNLASRHEVRASGNIGESQCLVYLCICSTSPSECNWLQKRRCQRVCLPCQS